jgi:hypothetical protein
LAQLHVMFLDRVPTLLVTRLGVRNLHLDRILCVGQKHEDSKLQARLEGQRTKNSTRIDKVRVSDVPGPAQSQKPGQAEPVWAGPSQAIGDGPARALARLRVS